MDGNNRWARREGYPGVAGHRAGAEVVREIVSACESRGIRYLTLFAFSSENWGRPRAEVRALLALLSRYLRNEVAKLVTDGIQLRVIGRRDRFSPRLQKLIEQAEAATVAGDRAILTLALDYGGRWDVAEVTRSIARDVVAGVLNPAIFTRTPYPSGWRPTGYPIPTCAFAPPERRASATFYFGSSLMQSSGSLRCCGPISTRRFWISLWQTTR